MLRSNLCDCSDTYMAVKRTITLEEGNDAKTRNKSSNNSNAKK